MVDRRILAVFLLATGAGLAETRCRAQEPRSRAEIKVESVLVSEPVTVRDAKGRAVSDLRVDNFLVTDNGVPQTILHFEVGGDALSLVLAVETSSRVASLLPKLRKTGVLLTQAVMGPNAEAAVVGFHDDVRKLRDFTTNADPIESTLAHLDGGTSGSKLYDALALGVEMLAGRQRATPAEPGRRRVLLVVAEADDHGSEAKLEEVLRRAQHENITISSVGLSTVHALIGNRASMKPADPGYGDNNLIPVAKWAVTHVRDQLAGSPLEIAAFETGGAFTSVWRDRSIESAIDELGGELHAQYLLTYTPAGTAAPGFHEIRVSVDRPKLKVRSRPGYYLEGPGN